MSGGEVEPVGRFGPDLAKVGAEMSEIFLQAGWGLSGSRETAGAPLSRRGGAPGAILLTALAAGVVGFGSGAIVARAPRTPVVGHAKFRAGSLPPSPLKPPTALPLQAAATPTIALTQADPVPVVPTPDPSPATKASPGRAKASAKAHARSRMKLQRFDGPKAAAASPQIRVRTASMAMAQPASCERDARGEDCRKAVVQADQHLQDIYQKAVRRGVSQEVLVDYRNRWANLREQKSDDPTRLIEGYGAMAYDLGRESAR